MKPILSLSIISSFIVLSTFFSCEEPDDKKVNNPPIVNSQEQITTVLIKGYNHDDPSNTAQQFTVKWEDLDGTGGNAPTIDSMLLDTGVEYHFHVLLLDKTKTPFDTISNEVEKEKNVHQFFYTPSANLLNKLDIERLDLDNNTPPLPVGMECHMKILATPTYSIPLIGNLNMVLSHYDGVPKTASPSSESDIDINFPVKLK